MGRQDTHNTTKLVRRDAIEDEIRLTTPKESTDSQLAWRSCLIRVCRNRRNNLQDFCTEVGFILGIRRCVLSQVSDRDRVDSCNDERLSSLPSAGGEHEMEGAAGGKEEVRPGPPCDHIKPNPTISGQRACSRPEFVGDTSADPSPPDAP